MSFGLTVTGMKVFVADFRDRTATVSGDTSVYVLNGNIFGNIYGGGSIAVVTDNIGTSATEGNTSVTVAGGKIGGTVDWGRVFGGGEGNITSDWAGQVTGSTNVTISNGTILGSVYGGGNFGIVGTENAPDSSINISISGSPDIAGNVYGGGKGDKGDISDGYQPADPDGIISNEIKKGNVYGNTSVTISGGKIGYLNGSSEQSWYDSEDSGSVYGGGKLGLVVGTTDVTISGNAEIHRNVYGGGKGLSKSVFIETDGNSISASLYNMTQILSPEDQITMESALWSNPSFVSKYIWEGSNDLSSGYTIIKEDNTFTGHSISSSEVTPYKFIRLTVKITNEVIGTESISSNVISISGSGNASKESWMVENRKLVQFGAVTEGTEVNISGGSIHTNVYGGGSYATVGTITGQKITENNLEYNFKHMISGGSTKVAINGGQIGVISGTSGDTHSEGGNVFGGGMGEPDNITTGSVGNSASIIISNGKINGNVYGGGENGFVGQVEIEISPTMTPIPLNNDTNLITYAYGLRISNSIGNETVGITNVTVSGGTVGDKSELNNLDSGNIFGAGKGVNATVTGTSSIEISRATVNGNVYGGGDLGAVGQLEGTSGKDISLTGGTANVTINSGEINGSVFGGGKGQSKSVSAEALILGTVQNTNVNITGGSINRISGDNPRGNVYGGGELGLVGALAELTEKDVIDNLKFTFTDGSTSVIISGSTTIAGNVYGGGKGEDGTITHSEAPLTTIILGSVAKSTEVKISERVSIGTAISGNLVDGTGNVYGGGELGIVGTYSDSNTDNTRIYVGGNSTIVISGGTILNEVYGGGEGTPKNVLSGAVGNATTIVSGSTTTIKGNVYGGGAYSIVGGTNVTIDRTPKDGKIDPKITAATNDATVNVVILGGTIKPDEFIDSTGSNLLTSSMGNVFGGGYGPKATVAGSTYIFIGMPSQATGDVNLTNLNNLISNNNLSQTAVTIFGNVFGGGDMGSIGFDVNTSQVDTPEFGKDYGTSKPSNISSNVSIKTYGTNITIGGISKNDKVGNIYAGGRGGNLIHIISNDPEKYETLKGYAIVHGDSNLIIEGTGNGNITISGSIYGAGQGVPDVTTPGKIDVILYAAVTGNTSISISKANVNNVYGGGQLSILGWYYDDANPSIHDASDGVANKDYRHYTGSDTKIIINNSNIIGSVYGGGMGTTANAISGAVGESTVIIGGGSTVSGDVYGGGAYAVVSNKLVVDRTSVDNDIRPTIASSDNISKAVIVILNAEISGNVFGGGYGPRAVIAGSTYVFIGISDNIQYPDYPSALIGSMANGAYHANITGSVYGGGNMGSVGFIEHLEGTDNEASFPLGYGPISSVSSNVILSLNDNKNAGTGENNRITVGGDVYGGGKGGDLYIPLLPSGASSLDVPPTTIKPEGWIEGISGRTLYGYAIVHGSSNVSITGVYSPGKGSLYIDISGNIFGGGEGIEASKGQNSLDVIVYAAVTGTSSVTISHSHIHGDIYGGGNLGVVGYFIDSDHASNSSNIFRNFTGKESNVKINASLIEGTVFGGGRGTTNNILSGAVGNTNVTIMGEEVTPIDGRDIAAASTITGSVYGGGAYALVGSMGITITVTDGKKSNPTVTECSNSSTTTVIILNSTIGSETQTDAYGGSGNVFGGGYGPRAVIAGSTNVYIGSGASNITSSAASSVTIYGSVFGGGNMGSIGVIPGVFSFDKVDNYSEVNSELGKYNGANITANVKVVINKESDDIHIKGSVYGGGKGGDLTVGPNNEPIDLKGYAVVYGIAEVYIHGDSLESQIQIDKSVYGGGLGRTDGVHSIQYAEIYDSTTVSVTYANIGGSVYGGGEYGIIGHFVDDKNGATEVKLSDGTTAWILERDFCGDAFYYNNGKPDLDQGGNGYKGKATTSVTIEGSSINGSVFGGGMGRNGNGNILSGAVGRETNVTINNGTAVNGNVYGGGEFGIVGSTTTQLIMITESGNPFTNSNVDTVSAASVIVNIPHIKLTGDQIESNLDIQNDVCTHLNINGGTISGSVFGAGKGENLNPLRVWTAGGINKADYGSVAHATAYNKLSVIGRTEVNISNVIINKHVYSGSENGDVGGFSTLKHLMQYLSDEYPGQPIDLSELASLDAKIRDDNTYTAPDGSSKNILNYQFSAAFVNIVGGTIHGNVFGGGYFGAIYGNTHVHIGWNSVMPYDDGSKGDCHYYNDYGDDKYAGKGHPFENNKSKYVNNLFINGTVFAGGDRGDPSATTINYDYISVYGSSHIFVNGTGYATGTDTSGETKAMYIQGSLFGSGNSCSTFYVDRDMSRFITITNYNAINDQNQFIIYSIQRATNVTLVNSSLRLPGRSDGSNVNKTALYSLNHIVNLTLQGGSELILDSVVQDLRSIYSKDGTGADTAQNNALNTIKLNNGITLIIKTEKGSGNVTSPNPALSNEPELWPDGEFGNVTGYFFLDLSDTSYYTAYVYGSLESQGGFVYGNSFGSLSGTNVPFEDFNKASEGYRAWHPVGGGHLSASSTIVADTDNKSGSEYVNYGKIVLPMTEAGAKFKLIGYDIYPAQAASLNDDKASLRLIGENVSFGNSDVNRFFKLKAVLGNGFTSDNLGESAIWLTSDKGDSTIPGREFIATGGATLPEIDLELHSAGVNQTTTAGYVVLLIQESIPVLDKDGNQLIDDKGENIYTPGNEISAIVNIETQAAGFGATKDNKNYENDMNLYATKEGEYSWNMSISNINEDKYRFELTNVSIDGNFNLVDNADNVNSKDKYMIRMNHSLNNDNSTGWDGFSFEEFALKTGNQKIFLGETDGRFNTSFQFIINNLKDSSGYAIGTVTLTISYYKISTAAKASEEPVLSADTTPDGTIQIEIHVGELKPWYNVKFVPAPGEPDAGVGAVATQQITHGDVADKPTPDPSRQDNKYSFGGWYRTYTDASEQKYSNPYSFDDSDPSAVITADTTLYGKWVSSVTFNYNYDNCPKPVTVRLSDKEGTLGLSMPQNPVRTGYTFDGWSTSETGTADFTGNTTVTENTTVYAKWTSNDYTVVFDANKPTDYGGDITVPTNNSTYKVGNTIDLKNKSPTPIKLELVEKQYDFKGWSVSKDAVTGSTESITLTDEIIKSAENGTITLYAVWVESTLHTVTLTTDPAAGKYVTFSYCTGDVTKETTWTQVTNGAFTVAKDTKVNIKYTLNVPNSTSQYPGYTFKEWSVTSSIAESTNLETLSFTVTADSGVTLNLTPSQITVYLELNGGTLATGVDDSITVTFGETYSTLPASNPTKLGYTFKGWYDSETNGNIVTSSTEVTNPQPHTLYAIWDPVTYNIVLHDGANTEIQSFNNYTSGGMSVQLISNPFKNMDGKIFKGWAKTSSSTTVEYSDKGSVKIMDEDIKKADTNSNKVALDLYAIWENPDLTLSFTKNGNPVISVIFDGYDWSPRIAALSGEGIEITIIASQGNSPFEFNSTTDTFKYEWTDQNGDIISSDGMVHKGIYNLKLTCSRTENGVTTEYKGEAPLEISPFTGTLGVILSPDIYTYNGLQPNILDPKNISVFIDKNGDKQYTDGEYKLSWNEITSYFDTTFNKNGTSVTEYIDAGTYEISLNAKNKADSDYYSNTNNSGASGSDKFTINPLPITIKPDANQWKYYGDDFNHIYNTYPPKDAYDYYDYKVEFTDSNGTKHTLNRGDLGLKSGIYGVYAPISGDLSAVNSKGDVITQFESIGEYNLTLGTISNTNNPNYTILLSESPVTFEIKKLPIIIKPDKNQWKYYGDLDNQIHKTNADGKITNLNEIDYKVFAKMNGAEINDQSEWLTLDKWNTTYATPSLIGNYNQLSGISVSYDSADRFKGAGQYDTTVSQSGNTNYDISIYADNSGNKIKFEVKKLPIFIVPEAGQWKYYGYDLTKPENFGKDYKGDSDSNAYIFIGKDDSKKSYSGLQYKVYDYRTHDIKTAVEIQLNSDSSYSELNGRLLSAMLNPESSVLSGGNKAQYEFDTSEIRNSSNPNYEIYSYDASTPNLNVILSNNEGQTGASDIPITCEVDPTEATIAWSGTSQTYNGADQSTNVIASYVDVNGNTQYISSELLSFKGPNNVTQFLVAGDYTVTADVSSLTDYYFEDINTTSSATMGKRSLTITLNDLTAEYNGTTSFAFDLPNGNIGVSALADGDYITNNKIEIQTTSKDVGTYTIPSNDITVSISTNDGINNRTNCYEKIVSGTLTVNKANLNISANNASKHYGENNPDFTATYEGFVGNDDVNSLSGTLQFTCSANEFSTPGNYDITPSGLTSDNYEINFIKGTLTVNKANLNISANNASKHYGENNPDFTATYEGFVGNDDVNSLSGTLQFTCSANEFSTPGNYDITPSGLTSDNYEINFIKGTLTVNKANLNISANSSINYNGYQWFAGTTDLNISGLVLGDSLQRGLLKTVSGEIREYIYDAIDVNYSKQLGTDFIWTEDLDTINGIENYSITYNLHVTITDKDTYKVKFDSNGGSEVSSVDVVSGEKVTKPADPTRSGYEFKGWYKDEALTDPWDFENHVVTADMTLYAKWEPKDEPTPTIYKVEYNANGGEGEVPKAELHFAGEFVTVKSADLRKNGYTFKGWCDSVTQTTYQPDEKFRMPSRDVCLTAVWESDPISGKEVSVTFIVDNEIYGISSTHIHTALNGAMQPDPIKEGFDFIGWYTKEGEVFTANTIVNNDMTVYAKFELNEDYVLVTYIIDNEVYMTLACKKTKIIEPNILAGMGKELNGWYTDKELKNKFDFNSVINEDSLTLYAEWKNNSNFMILFIFALFAGFMAAVIASTKRIAFYENKDDEEKYASVIMIGKGTLKDRLPSHSNNNFEGWYSESGELITEDTEITQSMKVYAHWKH